MPTRLPALAANDGNGLFDRLVIEPMVETNVAGEYQILVALKTANGQTLVRSVQSNLTNGFNVVPVSFEVAALLNLGEDGPHDVSLLEVALQEATHLRVTDRVIDAGKTHAFLLADFQQPALALTRSVDDQAFDDDGNGLFDRLVTTLEVQVASAGNYSWSYKLTDQRLNQIAFSSGSANLVAGLNMISLTFQGLEVGNSGADGPYLLRDLLLFGPGSSLIETDAGQTQPYLNSQFEIPADLVFRDGFERGTTGSWSSVTN